MNQAEMEVLRQLRMFAALPSKLQSGVLLMEWRLKHGTKWIWQEANDDPT